MKTQAYLCDRIAELEGELCGAMRSVAMFYRAFDPQEVADMNIRQAAARIGVSESTVTRFARRLGYDGYRAFQKDMRLSGEQIERLFPVYNGVTVGSDAQTVLRAVAAQNVAGIRDTLRLLRPQELFILAEKMIAARRIVLSAGGRSLLPAKNLAARLSRIGLQTQIALEQQHMENPANFLRKGDVLILFSMWMQRESCAGLMRRAQACEAYTAIFTANLPRAEVLSPDIIVEFAPEPRTKAGHTNTTITQTVVTDMLYELVYERLGETARCAAQKTNAAMAAEQAQCNEKQAFGAMIL